jgi:hypothetical protein
MNNLITLNQRYETVAWGAMLILLGGINLIPGERNGMFVLGVGMILLVLNLARYISKIPTSAVTIALGVIASFLGTLALLRPILHIPPIELFSFPVLLLLIGVYLLFNAHRRNGYEYKGGDIET